MHRAFSLNERAHTYTNVVTHTYGQITTRAFTHFSHRKNSMIFVNKRSVCAATNFNAHNDTLNRVDSDIVRREIEYQFIIELLPMCSLCRDRIYTQIYKCCSFRISWILWCLPFDNGERGSERARASEKSTENEKNKNWILCKQKSPSENKYIHSVSVSVSRLSVREQVRCVLQNRSSSEFNILR